MNNVFSVPIKVNQICSESAVCRKFCESVLIDTEYRGTFLKKASRVQTSKCMKIARNYSYIWIKEKYKISCRWRHIYTPINGWGAPMPWQQARMVDDTLILRILYHLDRDELWAVWQHIQLGAQPRVLFPNGGHRAPLAVHLFAPTRHLVNRHAVRVGRASCKQGQCELMMCYGSGTWTGDEWDKRRIVASSFFNML